MRPTRDNNERETRRQRPAGGFSLIELLIVIAIIGIIAAIGIPNLIASRRAANEASAISAIRTISSAEESYRATEGAGFFGTLADLDAHNIIDDRLATATTVPQAKSGYIYTVTLSSDRVAYCAGTAPATVYTGYRNFSSDTPGVIYAHPMDVANPPVSTGGGTPLN